jgi:hypothetical protein
MNLLPVCALLVASVAEPPFSDNQFVDSPRILPQLIAAAEAYGQPFEPGAHDDDGHRYVYYLRSATYVGNCVAAFGRVHVASFFFIRSAPKDARGTPSAHGHSFVAFFDASPRLRGYWNVDLPIEGRRLSFEGTVLSLDGERLFDCARLPNERNIVVDGKVQRIPAW